MDLEFFVEGIPASKGSWTSYIIKGKSRFVPQNPKKLKAWDDAVKVESLRAMYSSGLSIIDTPVKVLLDFYLPRPKSLPKKIILHGKKPDLDKAIRSVFDSMTNIVYKDDNLVYSVTATKQYATSKTGCLIKIQTS